MSQSRCTGKEREIEGRRIFLEKTKWSSVITPATGVYDGATKFVFPGIVIPVTLFQFCICEIRAVGSKIPDSFKGVSYVRDATFSGIFHTCPLV